MTIHSKQLISIICPVYDEEGCILIFYHRLMAAIEPLRRQYDFELIFTNNASKDRTLEIIRDIRSKDSSVQVITFSRNFGYQASVTAGLKNAMGSAVIIIDVDCEDPPEMVPQFIPEWEKGYDIVYGKRDKRPEFIGMQLARKAFYRITKLIADYDFILDMAEFALFSDRVREAILRNNSTYPFIRGELGFVGFKKLGISYAREPRVFGKSHYKLMRMITFAVGGILSSSTFPLRLAVYIGFPLALVNLSFLLYRTLFAMQMDTQWIFLLDFTYTTLILAFISTYLARSYKDGVQRPLFIIDWQNSHLNNRDGGDDLRKGYE
jgi:glycosyltransferase involved in cell wall biosynthesis